MRLTLSVFACSLFALTLFVESVSAQQPAPARTGPPAAAATTPGTPAPTVEVKPEVKAAYDQAVEVFKTGNFPGAIEILKKAYAANPDTRPPYILMTELLLRSNAQQVVPEALEMAIKETPADPEAYFLLAEIIMNQRLWTAADLLLGRGESVLAAYNANPERKKALQIKAVQDRALLCDGRQLWDQKQKYIEQLLALQGDTANRAALTREIAICLFQQKQEAPAREMFARADQIDGKDLALPADAMMARLYSMSGDMEKANAYLTNALKAFPTSKEVLSLAVITKLNEKKLEEAQAMAKQLHDQDPNSDNTKRLLAIVFLYRGVVNTPQGQYDYYRYAEPYFQELVTKSPSDSSVVDGLALSLCEAKILDKDGRWEMDAQGKPKPDMTKIQRAFEYASENVKKNQNNREYLATLGWVLFKAGRVQEALQVLQRSAADGQLSLNAAYYLANIHIAAATPESIESARKLLTDSLQNPQPFLKRSQAEELLKTLPAAPATPPNTPGQPNPVR